MDTGSDEASSDQVLQEVQIQTQILMSQLLLFFFMTVMSPHLLWVCGYGLGKGCSGILGTAACILEQPVFYQGFR